MKRVGLLVGRERSFPDALIQAVVQSQRDVTASYVSIDITDVHKSLPYDVIVDRISHEITCYQPMLKVALLHGCHVINNPFWRIADDKAFGTALLEKLGVPVPKTLILPSKAYGPDINATSLHSLVFPLSWEALEHELNYPMYMKPHWGGGFRDVSRIQNRKELFAAYNLSGTQTMIIQQAIEWQSYVRCIVIGKTEVLPCLWDPRLSHYERYQKASQTMEPLSKEIEELVIRYSRTICEALGYEMNTCEFAIANGVPYAIDFMNSAPDFDRTSLTEEGFDWVVKQMCRLVVERAHAPAPTRHHWLSMLSS